MGLSQEERALSLAGDALLKQTGVEQHLSDYVDDQVKLLIPKEYEKLGGYAGWMIDVVAKGKVEVKWNF